MAHNDSSAHPIRPDVKAFLDFLNAKDAPDIADMTLEQARASFLRLGQLAELPPRALALIRDLSAPGPAGVIPLRLYDARADRSPGPAIMFFHGGGFVVGDLESHHALCTEIAAEMDLPVIAVDYRRAPEHPFPAAPDDCEAATRWIAGSPPELGRQVESLILMGDSAGGNVTIVTTHALLDQPATVPVALQVPIYPLSDDRHDHPSQLDFAKGFFLQGKSMRWFGEAYRAIRGHHRAFPIYNDHAATPPTVLVTAGLDPLRDSGRIYGEHLVRAGAELVYLEMKGVIHGFAQLRKAMPSAQDDLHSIFAAMRLLLERTR